MKNYLMMFFAVVFVFFAHNVVYAGIEYQNFEQGGDQCGWAVNASIVTIAGIDEFVHSGNFSWKINSNNNYGGACIKSQTNEWHFNIDTAKNDRVSFWMYALPANNGDNNVSVKFFDHGLYNQNGFEVWTTKNAKYGEWTKLDILFSQLPQDFNFADVDKLQFVNYWPGTYYIDDISVVRENRMYQSFEGGLADNNYEYGWKWNQEDEVSLSADGEPVYSGSYSWKLTTMQKLGGMAIKSQEKKLVNGGQDFWHVDLNPSKNDRLVFWIYSLAENGFDNNIGVQFYDNNLHNTDETKVEVWTKETAVYGRWNRLTVLFSDLPADLNLSDINKIQFQVYWPGVYYFDDIMATGPVAEIDEIKLDEDLIKWNSINGAYEYEIQQSDTGEEGSWNAMTTLTGSFSWGVEIQKYKPLWLRLRWKEQSNAQNTISYVSDWSNSVRYRPPVLLINKTKLDQGLLAWTNYGTEWQNLHGPLDYRYEVEMSDNKNGPWMQIYNGLYPVNPLNAQNNKWYRVKALSCIENTANVSEASDWSIPQECKTQGGFVKADGIILRENDGTGEEILLKGVNLGGWHILEAWMSGIGKSNDPLFSDMDDWGVRELLVNRFGYANMSGLLSNYRSAYLSKTDFDNLYEMGVNFVRLPIYYKNFENENGNWILGENGQIDFNEIDNIIKFCADRNIYVLLDLHGAPGCQSDKDHTGRGNFNKLFENSVEGDNYRNKTIQFWTACAQHYSNNRTVMGYDLLNEPTGVGDNYNQLWTLYDQLYDAIREVDENHIIVMEGVWDWNTLPNPQQFNWQNIVYEFHYYDFGFDEDFNAQKDFIDTKVSENILKQEEYNIPVIIGEFNALSLKDSWEYYLETFNMHRWGWTLWNYKYQFSPSQWGLYLNKTNDLIDLNNDDLQIMQSKINKYKTTGFHKENETLVNLLKGKFSQNSYSPFINNIIGNPVKAGEEFIIRGVGFGEQQGNGSVRLNGITDLPINVWENTEIHVLMPENVADTNGFITINTENGESNEINIQIVHAPALLLIGNKLVNEGSTLLFTINGSDIDNNALTFSAQSLPSGATFNPATRQFKWIPHYAQSGTYNITFKVSDGIYEDSETITVTVKNIIPPAPFHLTYKLKISNIYLSWQGSLNSCLLGYEVYYYDDKGFYRPKWVKINRGNITKTNYTINSINFPHGKYQFKVRAVYKSNTYSDFSNIVQVVL
jgi:aryl-phospho-beta-D-glucosidase BglC (GH1 family)